MIPDSVGKMLAEGLWDQFEFELPDTPNRIVKAIFAYLEKNDLTIVTKLSLEPVIRCTGCGTQLIGARTCETCSNWISILRRGVKR